MGPAQSKEQFQKLTSYLLNNDVLKRSPSFLCDYCNCNAYNWDFWCGNNFNTSI